MPKRCVCGSPERAVRRSVLSVGACAVVLAAGWPAVVHGQDIHHVRTISVDTLGDGGFGTRDFGRMVRLSGRRVVVGAPSGTEFLYTTTDQNGNLIIAPAGQVYTVDALTGGLISKLGFSGVAGFVPPLGTVLGYDGDRAVTSTVNIGSSSPASGFGVVWDVDQSLLPVAAEVLFLPNYLAQPFQNERFGTALAIDDDIVVVGSIDDNRFLPPFQTLGGAAVVYDASTGGELMVLGPSDPLAGAGFGQSAAIDGAHILIGSGAGMYVFDRATGQQLRKISTPNSVPNFGGVVDTDAGRAAIGGQNNVYVYNIATGQQIRRFINPLGVNSLVRMAHTGFIGAPGNDVAISGDLVVATCRLCSITPGLDRDGAVFVFSISENRLIATLTSPDPVSLGWFGTSVSIDGNLIAVGEMYPGFDDDPRPARGLVHIFRVGDSGCDVVDLNADGEVNFFDVIQFLNLFNQQASSADFNGDGLINFFDIRDFLDVVTGCTG